MFKKTYIGFALLKNSFKSVFFSHRYYFIPCLVLAIIQFIHLKLTGLMHRRLTLGVLMTELLAGENFLTVLWNDVHIAPAGDTLFTLVYFILLLYIEIVLILFVLCTAAQYTLNRQNNSLKKSIRASTGRWPSICAWGLIELSAQGLSALLGTAGAAFYFVWNIITIFDVQILSFDRARAGQVLRKSWTLFKQTFKEAVALDLIIEGFLILIGLGIYFISAQYMPDIAPAELGSYNDLTLFLILYVISSAMIFEVVVFTGLYQTIEK